MSPSDRPQLATVQDAVVTSVDWLLEPCWKGDRLIARFEGGRVALTDQLGAAATVDREVAQQLARAIDADQAVIDGIWTSMPFVADAHPGKPWAAMDVKGTEDELEPGNRAAEGDDRPDSERRHMFVAWDLIELDGQLLHDIPLAERRRLLASVLAEGGGVRISPAGRPPIEGWFAAWRSIGFTHFIAKHINSRYLPGETTNQWLKIALTQEKASVVDLLLGRRPRKIPHISD
jgi:ATP-dependent DNA ligase